LTRRLTCTKRERDEHWTQTCTRIHKIIFFIFRQLLSIQHTLPPEEGWRLNLSSEHIYYEWDLLVFSLPTRKDTQLMKMLVELQKVLGQELNSLLKTTTVLSEWVIPKTMDVSLLHFYNIRNK
jgi:hypothetical protein